MNSLIIGKSLTFLFLPVIGVYYLLNLFSLKTQRPLEYLSGIGINKSNVTTEDCSIFTEGVLEETDGETKSEEKCWWLNSGGIFYVEDGIGQTLEKDIPAQSPWKILYKKDNPIDTDNGLHPQNIFRLINRQDWKDVNEEVFFRIDNYNLSKSPNRNMSNGVFLMSRYIDGENLYYGGIRVDGSATIKKKVNGKYTTLAIQQFEDNTNYDLHSNPILLPRNTWIGERLVTKNNPDGTVRLQFFVDLNDSGDWQPLLDVTDAMTNSGTLPFIESGHIGIRSDFMDIKFRNFRVMPP